MSATEQELRDLLNGCSCSNCNPEVYESITELVQEILDLRALRASFHEVVDATRDLTKTLNEIGWPSGNTTVFARACNALRTQAETIKELRSEIHEYEHLALERNR